MSAPAASSIAGAAPRAGAAMAASEPAAGVEPALRALERPHNQTGAARGQLEAAVPDQGLVAQRLPRQPAARRFASVAHDDRDRLRGDQLRAGERGGERLRLAASRAASAAVRARRGGRDPPPADSMAAASTRRPAAAGAARKDARSRRMTPASSRSAAPASAAAASSSAATMDRAAGVELLQPGAGAGLCRIRVRRIVDPAPAGRRQRFADCGPRARTAAAAAGRRRGPRATPAKGSIRAARPGSIPPPASAPPPRDHRPCGRTRPRSRRRRARPQQ